MSVSTDTVTAEVVSAPISYWWPAPEPTGLLFREEDILVVLHDLDRGEPRVNVLKVEPGDCEVITKLKLPREFYEAARSVLQGLGKLAEAFPLVRAAIKEE